MAARHISLLFFTTLLFALTGCGDDGLDMSGELVDVPEIETPTCGEPGVPVITEVHAEWDEERPESITVELRGLPCGADVSGFRFDVYDEEERNITGRSWPEVDASFIDRSEQFVVRGLAAGCSDLSSGARIELWVHGQFGTRCAVPVDSTPVSVTLN